MSEPQRDPLDELREYIANQADHIKVLSPGMAMFDDDLDRLADAWESEREDYEAKLESMTKDRDEWRSTYENVSPDVMQTVDELQAKLDAAESDNSVLRTECTEREKLQAEVDELREELDARTAERDGLQSFLCASIPMPVDLDGVLWTGEEETFIGWDGNEHELGSLSYANGAWKIEDADSHSCFKPEKCLHVSPKSTGRETLADVHASVETPVCEYFGRRAFEVKCKDCPEGDIWECSAKKVHDEIDRAYECGRRDVMDANGTASIGNGTCPDGEPF